MAPNKTNYPKESKPVYMEKSLRSFARKESMNREDCFHPEVGSASEHIRRGYKAWLLLTYPSIKHNHNLKGVDWDEAY